jgi:hypothetical protein
MEACTYHIHERSHGHEYRHKAAQAIEEVVAPGDIDEHNDAEDDERAEKEANQVSPAVVGSRGEAEE